MRAADAPFICTHNTKNFRAPYEAELIDDLADRLGPEFGSELGARRPRPARQFYRVYPLWSAVRAELNWYQYRSLITFRNFTRRPVHPSNMRSRYR